MRLRRCGVPATLGAPGRAAAEHRADGRTGSAGQPRAAWLGALHGWLDRGTGVRAIAEGFPAVGCAGAVASAGDRPRRGRPPGPTGQSSVAAIGTSRAVAVCRVLTLFGSQPIPEKARPRHDRLVLERLTS